MGLFNDHPICLMAIKKKVKFPWGLPCLMSGFLVPIVVVGQGPPVPGGSQDGESELFSRRGTHYGTRDHNSTLCYLLEEHPKVLCWHCWKGHGSLPSWMWLNYSNSHASCSPKSESETTTGINHSAANGGNWQVTCGSS
uniref:Uncharacterized protein n=1 Tax=Micrurus spixii TaxID=129469 RepID=A0A2D4LXJ1_9SAUR